MFQTKNSVFFAAKAAFNIQTINSIYGYCSTQDIPLRKLKAKSILCRVEIVSTK